MPYTPALAKELIKAVLWALLGGLIGNRFDAAAIGVAVALGLRLFLHLRYLTVLRAWLDRPKQVALPIVGGTWGEAFDGLLNLQKRNRKRKKKLAAILAEFQASTEALPDGAVVLGPNGEIVWFNAAAQAMLGLRLPQDLGLRVPNLVRAPAFTEYFGKGDYSADVEAPSALNQQVILSFRIIPYGNGQRLMIVRDISELKRLEMARRDFVANASHELRTPLTVLRGYLDVMEPESRGEGALALWRTPLAEMRSQAARMESLIADMLKLARLESDVVLSRQDLLEVPRMLSQSLEEAKAMSKNGHRFEFEVQSDLRLFGRDTEVQSIFTNLIGNAIQYTPPGGIIRVRWWGDDKGAHFAVADTGIGIADKDIPRVTERFYRVDVGRSRASGGTGLGLSIVKHALEHHEGRLTVDSELGVGSTFTCHFPPHRAHRGAVRGELRVQAH
ncbi:MAG: phosphate regulon sensor histidine kinase PhoR [Nevskia sp.]|nr:phosphate regulon sensor histidine kinase PhoR [Nevskia sp.]